MPRPDGCKKWLDAQLWNSYFVSVSHQGATAAPVLVHARQTSKLCEFLIYAASQNRDPDRDSRSRVCTVSTIAILQPPTEISEKKDPRSGVFFVRPITTNKQERYFFENEGGKFLDDNGLPPLRRA